MIGFLPKFRGINLNTWNQWHFAFESILCGGKTTMILRAKEYLESEDLSVACFENAKEDVREFFRRVEGTDDYIDTLYFTADTLTINKQIKDTVKVDEKTGKVTPLYNIILEERSFLSTLAYQQSEVVDIDSVGIGKIIDLHKINLEDWYQDAHFVYTSLYFKFPDVVFVLDVSVEEAFRRAKEDINHKIEKFDSPERLKRARQFYRSLANDKHYLFYIFLIEEKSLNDTWSEVKSIMDKMLLEGHNNTKIAQALRIRNLVDL